MLNKHNLNVAKLAAKDESRYTLTGIRVSPDETMCTDGHQLTRVTTPKVNVDDFPAGEGFTATAKWEPFILDAKAALTIAKAIPNGSTIPILHHAAIGEATNVNGHAQIMVNDLESPQVFTPRKIDGQFPDVERVLDGVPEDKADVVVGLGFDVLLPVLREMKRFAGNVRAFKMSIYLPKDGKVVDSGIRLDCENDDGQHWTSVVMPHAIDEPKTSPKPKPAAVAKPATKPKAQVKAEPPAKAVPKPQPAPKPAAVAAVAAPSARVSCSAPAPAPKKTSANAEKNNQAVYDAFTEKGIPREAIRPKENVLTWGRWRKIGRQGKRGERGVRIELARGHTTVFHESQTEQAA